MSHEPTPNEPTRERTETPMTDTTTRGPVVPEGIDPVHVRDWAANVGLTVAPKGRLSRDVLKAYAAAQQAVTA